MIVKLIRTKRPRGRLTELRNDVFGLTRYVLDADPWAMSEDSRDQVRSITEYLLNVTDAGVEPGKKAGYSGTRNLLTDDLASWQAEMLALAHSAPRVEYPLVHIIVSWPEGEQPSQVQLDDTVDTILSVTGMSSGQALFAEHTNTTHAHLHIAAVRIDLATGRAAGSEWLIENLHQSLAILEERHGWGPEPNALYYARGGAVFDAAARPDRSAPTGATRAQPTKERMVRDADGTFVGARARGVLAPEIFNVRSAILQASEEAKNWADFHQLLDAHRAFYRAKGSGAQIERGDAKAKASAVDAGLSRKWLEKKWGAFVPHPRDLNAEFEAYRLAHATQLKRLRAERKAASAILKAYAEEQVRSIDREHRQIRQAIEAERLAAQGELDAAYAVVIKACTDERFTQVERWREAGSPAQPPPISSPALLLPADPATERSWTPSSTFRAVAEGGVTRYYDREDRLAFADHRMLIVTHRPADERAIDEALMIASRRWTTVKVSGSREYQDRCARRAEALGIQVVDGSGDRLTASPVFNRQDAARNKQDSNHGDPLQRNRKPVATVTPEADQPADATTRRSPPPRDVAEEPTSVPDEQPSGATTSKAVVKPDDEHIDDGPSLTEQAAWLQRNSGGRG